MGMWMMKFNGARSKYRASDRIILEEPSGKIHPFSYCLQFECTKNITKYKALVIRLYQALDLGVKNYKVYKDSKIIMNQVHDIFLVKNEKLK